MVSLQAVIAMPRKPKSDEDKLLEQQVRDIITTIKTKDAAPAIDIPRAIRLFETAQSNISKALAVLRGEEIENTSGVGRPRKEQTEPIDSDAPGEPAGAKPPRRSDNRKAAATSPENA